MLAHWDDVEPEVVDVGELRGTWWDLGSAAGSFRAGVQRCRIEPGGRATPLHVHADEEELLYVLAGTGLSIRDDAAHPVESGDSLVHRVHEEPHALVAGDDGLEFLAFGPRAESNITWLPHARVMRVGPRWLPAEVDAPFEAEAAAGPLPIPPVSAERPPTIMALDLVPPSETRRGPTNVKFRDIGEAIGSETTGMMHTRIAPGARSYPHHCHSAEEELFVILGGEGVVRLGDERYPVRRGSVVARPPGTRVAHSFWAGESGLELLSWGTRVPNDIAYYPESGKVALRGVGVIGRLEPAGYWDGEE
jgi:uncharacterized cupin superfamily protein